MAEQQDGSPHRFQVAATWRGDGGGTGIIRPGGGAAPIAIGGATSLGGCGQGTNPEELLLAAVGSCFVNTWAIFLAKLKVPYAEPAIAVSGLLEKDPAGGFRMASIDIAAKVPGELRAERREDIAKTLQLAEKYCIVSKVARASLPLTVRIEET